MTADSSFSPNSFPETVVDKLVLLLWEFHTSLRHHLKTEVNLQDPCSINSFIIRTKASNAGKDLAHILNHRFVFFVRFAANLSSEVKTAFLTRSGRPCFSTISTDLEPLPDTTVDNLIQALWKFQTNLRDELFNVVDLRESVSTAQFIKGVNSSRAARELHHMLMYNFAGFVHFASAISSDVASAITDSSVNSYSRSIASLRKENEENASLMFSTDNTKHSDTLPSQQRDDVAPASSSTPSDLPINKQKGFGTDPFCFNEHGGKMTQDEIENDRPSPQRTQRHSQTTFGLPVHLNSSTVKNVNHSDRNPFQVVFQVNSTNIVSDSDRKLVSRGDPVNIEDLRETSDSIPNVASEIRDIHSNTNNKSYEGITKYERGTDCEDLYSFSERHDSKSNTASEIHILSPSTLSTKRATSVRKGENETGFRSEEHISGQDSELKQVTSSIADVIPEVSFENDNRSSDDGIPSNHDVSRSMQETNCANLDEDITNREEQDSDRYVTVTSHALKSMSVSSDGCSVTKRESTSDLPEVSDQIRQAILSQLKPDIESDRKMGNSLRDTAVRQLDGENERDKGSATNHLFTTENPIDSASEQPATSTPTFLYNHPIFEEDFPRKQEPKLSSDIHFGALTRSHSDLGEYGRKRNFIDHALDSESNPSDGKYVPIENLMDEQRSKRNNESQRAKILEVGLSSDTTRRQQESVDYSEKMKQFTTEHGDTAGSAKSSIDSGGRYWSQQKPNQGEPSANKQQNDNRLHSITNDTALGINSVAYESTINMFPNNESRFQFEGNVGFTMKNKNESRSNNEITAHHTDMGTTSNILPTSETTAFEKVNFNLISRKDRETDGISLRDQRTIQEKLLEYSNEFLLPPSASNITESNNSSMPLHRPSSVKSDSTSRSRIGKDLSSTLRLYTPSATDSLSQPTTPLERSLMNLTEKLRVSRSFRRRDFSQEKSSEEYDEKKLSNKHSGSFTCPEWEQNKAYRPKSRESESEVMTEADQFRQGRMAQWDSSSHPYPTTIEAPKVRNVSSSEWPLASFRAAVPSGPSNSTLACNGFDQSCDSDYRSNVMQSASPNWFPNVQAKYGWSQNKNQRFDNRGGSLAAQFSAASMSPPTSVSSYGCQGGPSILIGNSESFSHQRTSTKTRPYYFGSGYYDSIISYAKVVLPGGCTHIDTSDELREKLEGYGNSNYMAVMSLDEDHFLLLTSESKLKHLSTTYVYKCETCENTERAKRNRNSAHIRRLTITRVSKPVDLLKKCESLAELCKEATSECIRAKSALRYRMGRIYTELLQDLKRRVMKKMEDLKRERLKKTGVSNKLIVRASKSSRESLNDSESTCSFTSDDTSSASDDMQYQPNIPIDYYCQEQSFYYRYGGKSDTYNQYCDYLGGHYDYPYFDCHYHYPF